MGVLSFDDSGGATSVTLNDVAEMALAHGFEKKGPQTPGKKAAQRADMQAFFQTYGVKAFTPFKDKFENEKLLPPQEHLEKVKRVSQRLRKKKLPPTYPTLPAPLMYLSDTKQNPSLLSSRSLLCSYLLIIHTVPIADMHPVLRVFPPQTKLL